MFGSLVILIVVALLSLDCIQYGWKETIISSFWVFTLFYVLSYPVKYLFISAFNIEYVAPVKPDSELLFLALLLSFMFWLLVYVFRRHPCLELSRNALRVSIASRRKWIMWLRPAQFLVLGLIGISLFYYYKLLEAGGFSFSLAYEGNAQNEARVGSGTFFLLYTLYLTAFFISIFLVRKKPPLFLLVISFLVIVVGILEMVLLGTRRPLFLILYVFVLWLFINNKTSIYASLLAFYPVIMSLLAPVGQILRYSFASLFTGSATDIDYIMVSIGSTFEGVEHLANYLGKLNATQLLLGVDQGMAWLYNSGLSLIPRALWESKPLLYGSVAEQYYLYPNMYDSGAGQITLPPGIMVDSMYGFGIIFMFVLAFIYAKVFAAIDKTLFVRKAKPGFQLLIAAVLYIHMFNLVRGGTAVVMMLVILLATAIVFYLADRLKWDSNYD